MNERMKALPDLFVTRDGNRIETTEQWRQIRRPEMLALFRDLVFGKAPLSRPKSLEFNVTAGKRTLNKIAHCKQVEIAFKGPGGKGVIKLLLFIPNYLTKPAPVFLLINHRNLNLTDLEETATSSFWPAEYIVSRGYAAAIYHTADVDPDFHDEFQNGVHGIFDVYEGSRPKNAWGTIAAWAWGASRVMDYLETDSAIDANRVAVVGHSRGGKTALWSGAVDERFAMVVSNNSGSTGAAISRGKKGESVHNINTHFPHWFTQNYKAYNNREYDMPFDQHMLLSLIAPRLLYVTSATEDDWSDPESEFLSVSLIDPIYRLYGLRGIEGQKPPSPDMPVYGENVGYHLRTGKHDLLRYDWKCFMDFADKFLKSD